MRRHRFTRPTGLLLAGIAVQALATSADAQEIDTLALRAHSYFLSHDALAGRAAGSEGERIAGLYLAGQLKRLGIPGAGPGGSYFQPVPLRELDVDAAATRLRVTVADETTLFRYGQDFVLDRGGAGAFRRFEGTPVFVGTAALAAEAVAGLQSLDGRVVSLLGGLGMEAVSLLPAFAERGAEAVLLLLPDEEAFERVAAARSGPRMFVDAPVDEPFWQPPLPVLYLGPRASRPLLEGLPPGTLGGPGPFEARDLDAAVELSFGARHRTVAAANVAGLLPGRDPSRSDEVLIYTAHYDHLGIGTPDEAGDSIFNGFSDNAAGVAMVLAIAEAMAREPPARSVLFLFPTAEELGLLGSAYYVARPLVPVERTVAVINLDGGAPPAPPRNFWLGGGDRSTLGELGRRVGDAHGWELRPSEARPNSDHWPFLRRQVPAVFLVPGQDWEGASGAERERLHQRWGAYHQPRDRWHPEFPFRGLERYARVALALGREVGDAPEPPRMKGGDTAGH